MSRIIRMYKTFAVIFLNTVILLGLCFALYFLHKHISSQEPGDLKTATQKTQFRNPITEKYNVDLQIVLPSMSKGQIDELMDHTWHRSLVFAPFVQLKESEYSSNYVNVSPHGFRVAKSQDLPWPIKKENINVFVFGGSTTFGYGVPDDLTTAVFLEKLAHRNNYPNVRVYNFGCAFYYSSQERIKLETLLISGVVPDIVVFIDGLNELYYGQGLDEPRFSRILERVINTLTFEGKRIHVPFNIKLTNTSPIKDHRRGLSSQELARESIRIYKESKRITESICDRYGIKVLFAWQPVRWYKNGRSDDLLGQRIRSVNEYVQQGYEIMETSYSRGELGKNFLMCTDLHSDPREHYYIDEVHYSPEMNMRIAERIWHSFLHEKVDELTKTPTRHALTNFGAKSRLLLEPRAIEGRQEGTEPSPSSVSG